MILPMSARQDDKDIINHNGVREKNQIFCECLFPASILKIMSAGIEEYGKPGKYNGKSDKTEHPVKS